MVSDALKDALSEDQLDQDQVEEMFISVALVTEPKNSSLTGNLIGIEFGKNPKIDLKTSLKEAFDFIGRVASGDICNKKVNSLILLLGEKSILVSGPFAMTGIKIIEIDSTNKLCVLAVDLTKDT